MSQPPVAVLFVCIGNSCRSPMAEAFAHYFGEGVVEASSAGLYPTSIIQPQTIQVMAERGIKIEPREPRSVLLADLSRTDVIVNMTGTAIGPLLHGFRGREVAWQVHDPIGQSPEVYRAIRDQIEQKVKALVEELRKAG